MSVEGYLRPISIIVKVYPHMSEKVVIVGFMNSISKFEDMNFKPSMFVS